MRPWVRLTVVFYDAPEIQFEYPVWWAWRQREIGLLVVKMQQEPQLRYEFPASNIAFVKVETWKEQEVTHTEVANEQGPRYPHIEVQLTGNDGNAFAILGAVKKALRRHDVSLASVNAFMDEATGGDYNHLLATCMEWVTVL